MEAYKPPNQRWGLTFLFGILFASHIHVHVHNIAFPHWVEKTKHPRISDSIRFDSIQGLGTFVRPMNDKCIWQFLGV